MFSNEDLQLLAAKNISRKTVEKQLNSFKNGFPFLKIIKAASANQGVMCLSDEEKDFFLKKWDDYLNGNNTIVKFVPASGAASRMFKDLFEFVEGANDFPENSAVKDFFENIGDFAFSDELNAVCLQKIGKSIAETSLRSSPSESVASLLPSPQEEGKNELSNQQYKTIANLLLYAEGLNYGALPKGLLLFHKYADGKRTPVEEHLVESALYAKGSDNTANLHFTISPEHRPLFEKLIELKKAHYETLYNIRYKVSFSEQKPSTDTIAADANNEPFRENGKMLFRPGGHGALIENLNDIDADVVFIKNIDNVTPDFLKGDTILYKKLIAGVLVDLQQQLFLFLHELENPSIKKEKIAEIETFLEKKLCVQLPSDKKGDIDFLKRILNRPVRVCGMVKNEGEPGGGPYLTLNKDGSASLQILESSQINKNNPADKQIMMDATHFNPVDLVCGVRNYKGEKFNLPDFVDLGTGFISIKSKNGKELKALELPGLWNGAMSDWNTIFVEAPVSTFSPVKTVNDLLRKEHNVKV